MVGRGLALAAVFLGLGGGLQAQAAPGASDWAGAAFAGRAAPAAPSPTVTPEDLVKLRDLGALSLSPDGQRLTFSVRQGNPATNAYAMSWFIQPVDGSTPPQPLAVDGGQPIPAYSFGYPQAVIPPESALWAPDGRLLAYRRKVDHRIELWVADTTGGEVRRIADGASQVAAFAWDGRGVLLFRTGLNYARYAQDLRAEAEHGWLLDDRSPLFSGATRPAEPDCSVAAEDSAAAARYRAATRSNPACDVQVFAWTAASGVRPASPAETAALSRANAAGEAGPVLSPVAPARAADGRSVELALAGPDPAGVAAPLRRIAIDGDAAACRAAACVGSYFKGLGWARRGQTVWFLKSEDGQGRRDGAPRDQTALYEWTPATGAVRRVLLTDDLIEDCHVVDQVAYCLRETLTRPRHVVALSLNDGAVHELADPNPAFGSKVFPRIEKRRVTDFDGDPGYAYIVYPNGYQPGRRYPLVITQYRQRGFLRGQVGDEYPILPLAAAGFVVASLDRPEQYDRYHTMSFADLDAFSVSDHLRDRRRMLALIDGLVDELVRDGLVDDSRVALTGLSAGAETTHYALQHSTRFAAAIASSGVHDLTFFAEVPEGPQRTRLMAMFGATRLLPSPGDPISELAWSSQPERLTTPLLINMGEIEGLYGFEGLEALRHAGRPLEVRVFPDESHIKYHPQSIAGVYDNNIAWLEFWLQGREDPRPAYAAQYARWRRMRDQLGRLPSAPP
jgi:dipeptidyl aminopeptidase/acylaminoacyl peptidase